MDTRIGIGKKQESRPCGTKLKMYTFQSNLIESFVRKPPHSHPLDSPFFLTFHPSPLTLPSHFSSLPTHLALSPTHLALSLFILPTHLALSLFTLSHSPCPLTFHPSPLTLLSHPLTLPSHFAFILTHVALSLFIPPHLPCSFTFHPPRWDKSHIFPR